MNSDWGWWAGCSSDLFDVGPFPTKEDAIEEAFAQDACAEIEIDGEWKRLVHYAECCGLHYDCDECGTVPKACDACVDYLDPEECGGTFAGCRNEGSVLRDYDD